MRIPRFVGLCLAGMLLFCIRGRAQVQTLPYGVQLYSKPGAAAKPTFWTEFERIFTQWTAPAKPPFGRSVAFLVGVSDYKNLKPLPGVKADLDTMRDYLLTKGGFDQVYVAQGSAATPAVVEHYMMDVFHDTNKLAADDRLLFYYSGHGDDDGGGDAYLLFAGAVSGIFGDQNTVLPVDSFRKWSHRIQAKHVLFIFDACVAGEALDSKDDDQSERTRKLIRNLSGQGSRIVVTAGTSTQKTWYAGEKEKGHSVFTSDFIQTVKTADDGIVTIDDIIAKAKKHAAEFASRNPTISPAIPAIASFETGHRDGTFVFLNPDAKRPKLLPEGATVMGLRAKDAQSEEDRVSLFQGELKDWMEVKDTQDIAVLQRHCDTFRNSPYCPLAQQEIERLKKLRPVTNVSGMTMDAVKRAAESGDVSAMAELGNRYLEGTNGASRSAEDAKPWLEKAAKEGHADAAYRLSMILYWGAPRIPPDKALALEWLVKADRYGSGPAARFLGYDLMNGKDGLPRDEMMGVAFYKRAVDRGDAAAMTNLGVAYEKGQGGLEKDVRKAVELYAQAEKGGDTTAMINLGYAYEAGLGGLERDEVRAVELYQKAVDRGDPRAMNNLALSYMQGQGQLKQDMEKARVLLQRAADLREPNAMVGLARFYFLGLGGLEEDKKKAIALLRQAAELDSPEGMCLLGAAYERGEGVEIDKTKARELYRKAHMAARAEPLPEWCAATGD